jgi:hypothetical protein
MDQKVQLLKPLNKRELNTNAIANNCNFFVINAIPAALFIKRPNGLGFH